MAARSNFSYKILCTEDDADTRELILFVLRAEGYDVTCSDSPEDSLRLAKDESFDLLIVDSWIPGMSGLELTRKVREFNRTMPILFYTGLGLLKDKHEALEAGAQGYLVKPVDIDDLIAEVLRLITAGRLV